MCIMLVIAVQSYYNHATGIDDGGVKMDEEEVKHIADNCNTKKLNSKRVEVSGCQGCCLVHQTMCRQYQCNLHLFSIYGNSISHYTGGYHTTLFGNHIM